MSHYVRENFLIFFFAIYYYEGREERNLLGAINAFVTVPRIFRRFETFYFRIASSAREVNNSKSKIKIEQTIELRLQKKKKRN